MASHGDSSFLYLPPTARLSDYSAAVKGASSVITIKIMVSDTYALGQLLEDLGSLKRRARKEVADDARS